MSLTAWLALAVFATAYVVIVSEKFNRTLVALLGAAAMVAIGSVRGHEIFFSEETGIDWNVIFLLFGMMVIVGVLRQSGVTYVIVHLGEYLSEKQLLLDLQKYPELVVQANLRDGRGQAILYRLDSHQQ